MFSPYTSFTSEWSNSTFIFYLSLIILGFLAPKVAYTIKIKSGSKTTRIRPVLGIYELILILVKGLSVVGLDANNGYYFNFLTATSYSKIFDKSLEKGFIWLTILLRSILKTYWLYLLVLSIFTLTPVFYLIHKYRNIAEASVILPVYVSIYFFQGFSLVRIALASSIALFAFDALYEGKIWKALIIIIIAAQFHVSMYVLLIIWALNAVPKKIRKLCYLITIITAIVLYLAPSRFASLLIGRHSVYSVDTTGAFGFSQFLYSVPLILLAFMYFKKQEETKAQELFFMYVILDFIIGLLAYRLPVGRMYLCFAPIPFLMGMRLIEIKAKNKNMAFAVKLLIIVYCVFRFYVYISAYYNVDEIMPYINVLGWKF